MTARLFNGRVRMRPKGNGAGDGSLYPAPQLNLKMRWSFAVMTCGQDFIIAFD